MAEERFDLAGLDADNLLALLALIGLLRLLESTNAELEPRASWVGPSWHPRLHVAANISRDDLITSIRIGFALLDNAYTFDGKKNIKQLTREEYGRLVDAAVLGDMTAASHIRLQLLSALGTNSRLSKGPETPLEPTVLCAIHGQGHQNFFPSSHELIQYFASRGVADIVDEELGAALFSPWRYRRALEFDDARGMAFRWDARDDRRHAYQFYDPTNQRFEGTWVVPAANALAVVGFSQLIAVPRARGVATLGFGRAGSKSISWPIWRGAIPLAVIRRVLTHPLLQHDPVDRKAVDNDEFAVLGVVELMRAERINNGKFLNFSRAHPLLGFLGSSE